MSRLGRHSERLRQAEQLRASRQRAELSQALVDLALRQRRFIQVTGRRDPEMMRGLQRLTERLTDLGATQLDLQAIGSHVNRLIQQDKPL